MQIRIQATFQLQTTADLILYDFGMVGRLDSETRIRLIRLYLGLIDKDPERTVNVLIELGTLEPTVNRYIVERGIALSIQSLHGRQVDRMEVKAASRPCKQDDEPISFPTAKEPCALHAYVFYS